MVNTSICDYVYKESMVNTTICHYNIGKQSLDNLMPVFVWHVFNNYPTAITVTDHPLEANRTHG